MRRGRIRGYGRYCTNASGGEHRLRVSQCAPVYLGHPSLHANYCAISGPSAPHSTVPAPCAHYTKIERSGRSLSLRAAIVVSIERGLNAETGRRGLFGMMFAEIGGRSFGTTIELRYNLRAWTPPSSGPQLRSIGFPYASFGGGNLRADSKVRCLLQKPSTSRGTSVNCERVGFPIDPRKARLLDFRMD